MAVISDKCKLTNYHNQNVKSLRFLYSEQMANGKPLIHALVGENVAPITLALNPEEAFALLHELVVALKYLDVSIKEKIT